MPEKEPKKLFEHQGVVVAVWKDGDWVDFGRGKFRAWKLLQDTITSNSVIEGDTKTTNDTETHSELDLQWKCWLSMISLGTLKELLTVHEYREEKIDHRVILCQSGLKISVIDPEPYSGGVLVGFRGKYFLFKKIGKSSDDEKFAKEVIEALMPFCNVDKSLHSNVEGQFDTEDAPQEVTEEGDE